MVSILSQSVTIRRFYFLIVFFLFLSPAFVMAQSTDNKIADVFGPLSGSFFNQDNERYQLYVHLLEKRIRYVEEAPIAGEKYPKLSSVSLLNKYNPDLQRDVDFNQEQFNPLKYNLDFFSKLPKIYRIDNTFYLLVIDPQ